MSFRTFAAGGDDFHFERDNCIDQDFFDGIDIIHKLSTMDPSLRGAGEMAAGEVLPSAPSAVDAIVRLAEIEFLHNLNNAVSFLAMRAGAGNGWISLSTRQSHLLWPDTVTFSRYDFSPGNNPGAEFIRLIVPKLEETDMNNWGVLRMIGGVLAIYDQRSSGTPMINIQLSK
jgi:hypothetical protein